MATTPAHGGGLTVDIGRVGLQAAVSQRLAAHAAVAGYVERDWSGRTAAGARVKVSW